MHKVLQLNGFRRRASVRRTAALVLTAVLVWASPAVAASIGPQVPLTKFRSYSLAGDVVVGGIGLRNRGGGTLPITLPPDAVVVGAYLYWSLIAPEEPAATGTLNDEPLAGELIAQTGSACWPTLNDANQDPPTIFTWTYRADVTSSVAATNALADLPSGLTTGDGPTAPGAATAYPLLDGASLVAVYARPGDATRNIVLYDGARTFFAEGVSTTLDWGAPGAIAPVSARTVFTISNGQAFFPGDQALFDGTVIAGPTATLRAADAFDGTDGGGPIEPHGLWDALAVDVSAIVSPGATSGVARVVSGDTFDCLTWIAQVASVVTGPAPTTTTSSTLFSPTTSITTTTVTTTSSTTTPTSTSTTSSTTSSSTTTSSTSSTSTSTSTSSSSTTSSSSSSTSSTSSSTTTTTSSTSTTTSTLPGCDGPRAATYPSIRCRLDALVAFVTNEPQLDAWERLFTRLVARAVLQLERSEAKHRAGNDRTGKTRLRSAIRSLTTFDYRVDSLVGKRGLDAATREALGRRVNELRDDMRQLRAVLGPGVP